MEKRIVLLTILAVIACAGNVLAGERAGAVSVSPFVGGYTFDGEQHLRTRPVYGLRLGYDFTDSFATEAVFDYVAGEGTLDHLDYNSYSYRMDLLYNFVPHQRLVPYLAIGGGGTTIERRLDDHETFNATFNAGGGLKFFLTDSIALRADARYLLRFLEDDHHQNNAEYSLGLTFLFGGEQAAMPAAEKQRVSAPAPAAPPATTPPPQAAAPAPVLAAEPTPEKMKYCTTLKIFFDIDRADIRPEYNDEVARVADFMKKYPTTTAVIEGYADEVGSDDYNMQLSQKRAESVVTYLVERLGVDRTRLAAKGYGKTKPIADNATEDGRQQNRRIQAVIDCAIDVKELAPPPERLCMTLNVQFDAGKADVKPEYRDEIAKVADYMKRFPMTTALIEGHTDNVGEPAQNMRLSQHRAENVVNYLVQNFGIDRARLSAKGYGDTRRIAYNDTPGGRQENRRINAIIDCVVKTK